MKFKTKYKLMLWKSYFDKGLGITNYFKYLIAFYALASQNIVLTFFIGLAYGVLCFFIGWFWFKFQFVKAEQEVQNRYNLFVLQMRKRFK